MISRAVLLGVSIFLSYALVATSTPTAAEPQPASRMQLASATDDAPITVMTYNVRLPGGPTNDWDWDTRFPKIVNVIETGDPGILGIQEARETSNFNAPTDLMDSLGTKTGSETDADVYGVALPSNYRDANGNYVPTNGTIPKLIFYRKARFEEIGGPNASVSLPNPYNSSSDPESCYQKSLDRELAWAVIRDKRYNQNYFVLNTHPVSGGGKCWDGRNKSSNKVHDTIKTFNQANLPVIVTCDCNFDDKNSGATDWPQENSIGILGQQQDLNANSTYELKRTLSYTNFPTNDTQKTYLDDTWPGNMNRIARLDYIFLSLRLGIDSTDIIRKTWPYKDGAASPSDHFGFVSKFHYPR